MNNIFILEFKWKLHNSYKIRMRELWRQQWITLDGVLF